MDRTKCEKMILEKIQEIEKIYKEYAPKEDYLAMTLSDGVIMGNNGNHSINKIDFYWDGGEYVSF